MGLRVGLLSTWADPSQRMIRASFVERWRNAAAMKRSSVGFQRATASEHASSDRRRRDSDRPFDSDPMVLTAGLQLQVVREHRGNRTGDVEVERRAQVDGVERADLNRIEP